MLHSSMLRSMLHKIREKRVRPGLDDKVLADWNGLMIAAPDPCRDRILAAGLDRDGRAAPSPLCATT